MTSFFDHGGPFLTRNARAGIVTEHVEGLHDMYCKDSRWCLQLARQLFPADWPTLGVHATTAAAYGLRFVELMTCRPLDARQALPRWVGEWAIW